MYPPAHYQENDRQKLLEFIRQYNFATVTVQMQGEYHVAHIPIVLKDDHAEPVLFGHFAANNPIIGAIEAGESISLVFNGPHCFVSSTWYDERQASTWNYMMVHVQTVPTLLNDAQLVELLDELIVQEEGPNSAAPRYADLPESYTQALLPHIKGVRMPILQIRGVFKLSQNKPAKHQQLIIEQLEQRGDTMSLAIAQQMKK